MMDYELIALDLDGTLTTPEKKIPPTTRAALIDLMKKGKTIALASGRPVHGVLHVARDLEMDKYGGYVMGFNGGQVIDCRTWDVIHDYRLPNEMIGPVYQAAKEYPGICVITYKGDTIIAGMEPNRYVGIEEFSSRMKVVVSKDFLREIPRPINKLLICGEPDQVDDLLFRLKESYGRLINLFISDPYFGEVMPKGIDKGVSLKILANELGIAAENVMACGDSENDIAMLRYAGKGVAMANALPSVKEAADYITLSNSEEGVLHVLKEFGIVSGS